MGAVATDPALYRTLFRWTGFDDRFKSAKTGQVDVFYGSKSVAVDVGREKSDAASDTAADGFKVAVAKATVAAWGVVVKGKQRLASYANPDEFVLVDSDG